MILANQARAGVRIVSDVETSLSLMMGVSTRACPSASRAALSCSPWGDEGWGAGVRALRCSALRDQCVIIRGVEQLLLSDSPVSGMVLATHEGAQQECNRPDQLRQCRYHCYSDLGFLLPIQTSPPPLTRTSALCQPSHLLSSVSTPRQECCWPGAMPWRHPHRRTAHPHVALRETVLSQTPVPRTPSAGTSRW